MTDQATATLYCVVKITTIGDKDPETEVFWEGPDIQELSQKYPPSEVFGADELGHHEIEGGHIRWSYAFHKFETGRWIVCEDPRVQLRQGLSGLEREIDAENRRMFPGDFLDEEDYEDVYELECPDCGSPYCDGYCPERWEMEEQWAHERAEVEREEVELQALDEAIQTHEAQTEEWEKWAAEYYGSSLKARLVRAQHWLARHLRRAWQRLRR